MAKGRTADLITLHGALYGTTAAGGVSNLGTAFELTTGGNSKVIYNFTSAESNSDPNEGLTAANGELFGTTSSSIFAIKPDGTERLLHAFAGGADGYEVAGTTRARGAARSTASRYSAA